MKIVPAEFAYLSIFLILLVSGCAPKHIANTPPRLSAERVTLPAARSQGRVGPADIYPDPSITPGAPNPSVSQDNIKSTICVPHWTDSARPPTNYTDNLKKQGFDQYGDTDRVLGHYEEDHFISLELGGDPRDAKNLWPEPYNPSTRDGGARFKDKVEKYLNRQVCNGTMTLADAQKAILGDWYQIYLTKVKK